MLLSVKNIIKGEARDVANIKAAKGGDYIITSINNDKLYIFKANK